MTLTRRTLCQAAVAAAVTALTGCGAGRYSGAEREIRIAGGQPGGFGFEVAKLLAREVGAAEPRLRCQALATGGSVENVTLIGSGDVDIAVCQTDMALAAVEGTDPFDGALPVVGIGRMYEDYAQLVVRADSDLHTLADLAGRTVSLGTPLPGTAKTGERLLAAARLQVVRRFDTLTDAADLLAGRRIDALFWCGGVPTPALAALHAEVGIRLLPLAQVLPALRARYGMAYQAVTIPVGGYDQAGTATVGVANLLLCGRSTPDDVVAAITGVVVERAALLVPPQALGTQFLDKRALVNLLGVPMHPGAAATYRQLHG